jgi:hypothetical protein
MSASQPISRIETMFAEQFSHWKIRLPQIAVQTRRSGSLYRRGWHISWVFGEDAARGPYLDYYARHRMTNDRHVRFYESGEVEDLPAIPDFMIVPPDVSPEEQKALSARFQEETSRLIAEVDRKFAHAPLFEDDSVIPGAFKEVFARFGHAQEAENLWLRGPVGAFEAHIPIAWDEDGSESEWDRCDVLYCFGEDDEGNLHMDYAFRYWFGDRPEKHLRRYESGQEVPLPKPSDSSNDKYQQRRLFIEVVQKYTEMPEWASAREENWEYFPHFWSCPEDFWPAGVAVSDLTSYTGSPDERNEEMQGVNEYVARVLAKHAPSMLAGDGVAVPHDAEEMNWRLFFAHSQDMMGFRADIFTGGPNEDDNPFHPAYRGLRDRWADKGNDSKTMIAGLAALWNVETVRQQIVDQTKQQGAAQGDTSLAPMLELLRGEHANEATRTFADALDDLTGPKIAYKTRRMVRAYIQNSALLVKHGCSFMEYLRSIVPDLVLPSDDIVPAERAWLQAIESDFYNVGPAIANYLICDWLLWLWLQGQISWFESYKADSVFLKTLADDGKLPQEAAKNFVEYCRSLTLGNFVEGKHFVLRAGYSVPPRILNEAIWLEEAATSHENLVTTSADTTPGPSVITDSSIAGKKSVDIERVEWPERFHRLWPMNVEEEDGADQQTLQTPEGVQLFRDDDEGYLAWLKKNPKGFVINAKRKPSADYLILHRAACWSISRPLTSEERWTAAYIKICASQSDALAQWARDEVGGNLHLCGMCRP